MLFSAAATTEPIQFGPYLLTECVGQGGMAVVYKATRHGPSGFTKTVVVKAMLPALSSQREFVAHVLRRSAPDGAADPPEHRAGARLRRRRRHPLSRHGVPAGAQPVAAARRRRRARAEDADRLRARHRARCLPRARLRARLRRPRGQAPPDHPPRRLAVERDGLPRRLGQAARLRRRQDRRRVRLRRHAVVQGQVRVHVARAGERTSRSIGASTSSPSASSCTSCSPASASSRRRRSSRRCSACRRPR